MTEAIKKATKRRTVHILLTVAFMLASLALLAFRFQMVFERTVQAVVDLGNSIAFYSLYPFYLEDLVTVTVTDFPANMETLLPLTFAEFKLFFARFKDLVFDLGTWKAYSLMLLEKLGRFAEIISPFLLPFVALFLVLFFKYRLIDKPKKRKEGEAEPPAPKHVDELLEDSGALEWYKRNVEGRIERPIVRELRAYIEFFAAQRWYIKWAFILVWAYNFNILTIAIEGLAWIFYVSMSTEYGTFFVQFAKLVCDLAVPFGFLPWWAEAIIYFKIFDMWRRHVGLKRLLKRIETDDKFLDEHAGALLIYAKQRSFKTALLVTLKKLFERRFRTKAKERFIAIDKKFPFFPWWHVEQIVKRCRDMQFKTFDDIAVFALAVKKAVEEKNENKFKFRHALILKYYGFNVDEVVQYSKHYNMTYDNGICEISVWEALKRYAQLYFIYRQPSTLDISMLPIREDFTFKDHGYFPIFDGNPFRKTKDSQKYSQYSHRMKFDIFRSGETFDKKSRFDEAVEYGIGVCPEFAKERKNKNTRGAQVDINGRVNQNNDGFDLDTKLRGQIATIDFVDFWVWLFDDQRADSLNAENKDLTTGVLIKERSDAMVLLPCYAIEELLCLIFTKMRDAIKYGIRNRKRKKETLFVHLLDKLYIPYFKHCDRIENFYSVFELKVKTTDEMDGEVLGEREKLYVPKAFTFNDTYATDAFNVFYRKKYKQADCTLNKITQFSGLYPTVEDYDEMQSYLVTDLNHWYMDK